MLTQLHTQKISRFHLNQEVQINTQCPHRQFVGVYGTVVGFYDSKHPRVELANNKGTILAIDPKFLSPVST